MPSFTLLVAWRFGPRGDHTKDDMCCFSFKDLTEQGYDELKVNVWKDKNKAQDQRFFNEKIRRYCSGKVKIGNLMSVEDT